MTNEPNGLRDSQNTECHLITPRSLKAQYPLSLQDHSRVSEFRKTVANIIKGKDARLLVICGPCSIHDCNAAIEYAQRLKALSDKVQQKIFIVMRSYFEKPRTTVGWKGLINDPYYDGACDIEQGLKMARDLSIKLTKIGVPIASEMLDPNISYYFDDVFSWAAIGARTTESPTHREMASRLPMPVGFKNNTNSCVTVALNAVASASRSHRFIGINQNGHASILTSPGNLSGHIILRSGKTPNYYPDSVQACIREIKKSGLSSTIVIDCSHGNANKDYRQQAAVAASVIEQITRGNRHIVGLMLESNINEGNQPINATEQRQYGVSMTDGCINWKTTEDIILDAHQALMLASV